MDYKISQALEDLKNYYGLNEFKEVNLNMEDVSKPFIKFKSGDDTWILTLKKEYKKPHWYSEEGENGTL